MPIPRDILKGWTVLVVDDEPDSLDVADRILRRYSATVFTAVNGKDGLEQALKKRPKLIISDISMPIMDGWEFIRNLKLNIRTQDIPVIALTAHAMPGDRTRAMAAGFHNHLTKPLTVATFINDLIRVLVDIPDFAAELGDVQND